MRILRPLVASLQALFLWVVQVSSGQEFSPISGQVPQDFTGVVLPAFCAANTQVVQTVTTLEPREGNVTVLTYPPDLVTVTSRPGISGGAMWLLLTINQAVASNPNTTEGGIKIQLPPSQLERVDVCCSGQVQILEGFTNVKSLLASASASMEAKLSTEENSTTNNNLDVVVSTSGSIAVDFEGGDCNIVSVGTSGSIELKANSVNKIDAGTSGIMELELQQPPAGGRVTTSAVVEVSAPNGCDNLGTKTSGTCTVNENLAVQVSVGETLTRSGKEICPVAGGGSDNSGGTDSSSGGVLRASATSKVLILIGFAAMLIA